MLGDGTICGEEPLCAPRGLEPLWTPLPPPLHHYLADMPLLYSTTKAQRYLW
jgi:hypothetical protein